MADYNGQLSSRLPEAIVSPFADLNRTFPAIIAARAEREL
jgi:hypothetical protein